MTIVMMMYDNVKAIVMMMYDKVKQTRSREDISETYMDRSA
jgi:hypothetical protein